MIALSNRILSRTPLKTEGHHDDDFFVSNGFLGCQNNNTTPMPRHP